METRLYTSTSPTTRVTPPVAKFCKGSPSHLGIAEFIVPAGSFFHAQTPVSFHSIEELFPKCEDDPYSG